MTITYAQYTKWLKSASAVRCILLEVDIGLAAGGTTTRYLSNRGYNTGPADTPASTYYMPRINASIKYTRSLSLSGDVSMSFGDIELDNTDGALDSWVLDYWKNRSFRVYLGDVTWARSDFRQVFVGTTLGIDTKNRRTVNIQISDKLQRLNTTLTETKLGGTTQLYDKLVPMAFGECHNITPLLTNPGTLEYQVHNGAIERVIEVRDNGVPVSFSSTPATGKFKLNQAPVGQITCSVQGALLPTSIVQFSDRMDQWTGSTNVSSVSLDAVTGPYGNGATMGAHACGIIPGTTANAGAVLQAPTIASGLTAGADYTSSLFVKPGTGTNFSGAVELRVWDENKTAYIGVKYTVSGSYVLGTSGGTGNHLTTYTLTTLSNGWVRVSVTGYPTATSVGRIHEIVLYDSTGNTTAFTPDGTSTYAYVSGWQIEAGSTASAFWNDAALTNGLIYRNTIGDLIPYITMNLGSVAANRLLSSDINLSNFSSVGLKFRQPVGLYCTEKTNVLDICNQLAASVGGRLYINASGAVDFIQLADQTAGAGTQVTTKDILERTLEIASLPPVVAGVSLGYCKNWTVQSDLASGLDQSSIALFQTEWLTSTQTDSGAAANYNLYLTPNLTESLLIVASDASTEAVRRLNMFNHQRMVVKYTGFYSLINETLGGAQTITHPRFGLSSGKTGQIISIAVDFLSPHVEFEVLI